MSFVSSTDQRPVYLDNTGNPMVSGKLFYTSGVESSLKTVYSDIIGTEAFNPQILGNDGRTFTEIYLGEGRYKVFAYRFEGIDPIIEPFTGPSWVFDHSWEEDGVEAVDPAVITIATVGTIAELEAVNPNIYTRCNVLGYYTEGDLYPRFYEWDALDNQAGNLGTVIKHITSSTGCWKLVIGETAVTDVRIFGVIPGTEGPHNGGISSASMWVQNTIGAPNTLYFPQGEYRVSGNSTAIFNCGFKTDPNVNFLNINASTTYTLQISGDYDIAGITPLKSGVSAGDIGLIFSKLGNNMSVRASWWGLVTGIPSTLGVLTTGNLLHTLFGSIPPSYTVVIDARLNISGLQSDLVIPNKLLFVGNGRINNLQTTHTIEFIAPGSIQNATSATATGKAPTVRGCLSTGTGDFQHFKFTNYTTIRSNWFADDIGSGNTIELQKLFSIATPALITEGTKFIFDHPVNLFGSSSIDGASIGKVVFERELGIVSKPVASSSHVIMPTSNFGSEYFIASNNIWPLQNVTKLSNFCPIGATNIEQTTAFGRAFQCACNSGGILDLGGTTVLLTSTIGLGATSNGCIIRNGSLQPQASFPIFTMNLSLERLIFYNVTISGQSVSPLIQVSSGATIGQLGIDFCTYACSSASAIKVTGSGIISSLDIGRSLILATNIVNAPVVGNIIQANIHDNTQLIGDFLTDGCQAIITGNNITGKATGSASIGIWQYSCSQSAITSGNHFYQCDLQIMDNEGVIDAVVTGNQFESTLTKFSRILYKSRTIGSYFAGAVVSGNSWTGTTVAGTKMITVNPTPAPYAINAWNDKWNNKAFAMPESPNKYFRHDICITDNTSEGSNMIVPCTRGAISNAVVSAGSNTTSRRIYPDLNVGMFYMQGSGDASLKYLNAIPNYASGSTTYMRMEGYDPIIHTLSNRDYFTIVTTETTGTITGWSIDVELYAGAPYTV